jgi:hypothetical protein
MGAVRRRRIAPPKDTREIVMREGFELTCDEHKAAFCVPAMNAIDAMPREWRDLINEYGAEAHFLFEESVPMFSHQKRLSAAEAGEILRRGRASRRN